MARINKLDVPVDEIFDTIYGNKLERGGYIEIVIPAIKMAGAGEYTHDDDLGVNIEVADDGTAVIPKYLGRKHLFIKDFTADKDIYSKEHIVFTTTEKPVKKNADPVIKTHELTFYWRQVKKTKKGEER